MPELKDTNRKFVILFIVIAFVIGFFAISKLAHEVVYTVPETEKLQRLVCSNKDYGNALQYVKIEGKVNTVYQKYYGIFFSVSPQMFEYNKDSILNKKVFYIEDKENIWFYQTGVNGEEIRKIKSGDCIKKNYGETKFEIINRSSKL